MFEINVDSHAGNQSLPFSRWGSPSDLKLAGPLGGALSSSRQLVLAGLGAHGDVGRRCP